MDVWIKFFFGHPRRFLITLAVVLVAFGLARPDVAGEAVSNLLGALLRAAQPFVEPVLTLAVIAIGFRVIWRGLGSKKK